MHNQHNVKGHEKKRLLVHMLMLSGGFNQEKGHLSCAFA